MRIFASLALFLILSISYSIACAPQNIISVISYGATGNGVTDDTTAIQSAITAARVHGNILYFPAGTYIVTQELDVTGISIIGDGPSSNIHTTATAPMRPIKITQGAAGIYNYDGNQVQLKFSGSGSLPLASSTTYVSDWANFAYTGTGNDLVVGAHFSGTTVDLAQTTIANSFYNYLKGSDVSGQTTPAGSWSATGGGVFDLVTKIETDPGSGSPTTIFSQTLAASEGIWQGYNLRQHVPASALSAGPSGRIRVTIKTGTGLSAANLDSLWIGEKAAPPGPTNISYVQVSGVSPGVRDDYSSDIYIGNPANNWTIDHVTLTAGNGTGIKNEGGTNGTITNNAVSNTSADCIYNSFHASGINIQNNTTTNCGDDTISVVSYMTDGSQSNNVLIKNNTSLGTNLARGITVVGGKNVTIDGNHISNTKFAGIYLSAEPSYNTLGDDNILVQNNTFTNVGSASNGHGAFFINASQNPGPTTNVTNVLFQNNTINSSNYDGIRMQYAAATNNAAFLSNTINNFGGQAFRFDASPTNFYCHLDAANGTTIVPPAFNTTGCIDTAPNFTVTGSTLH